MQNHYTDWPKDRLKEWWSGRWARSCGNTLQKFNVSFYDYVLINKKGFCLRCSFFFQTSGSTCVTSSSLARCWIVGYWTFNVFQPKILTYIICKRRNCQSRHTTRHFSEQEKFQSIFFKNFSILRKVHSKPPPVHACVVASV